MSPSDSANAASTLPARPERAAAGAGSAHRRRLRPHQPAASRADARILAGIVGDQHRRAVGQRALERGQAGIEARGRRLHATVHRGTGARRLDCRSVTFRCLRNGSSARKRSPYSSVMRRASMRVADHGRRDQHQDFLAVVLRRSCVPNRRADHREAAQVGNAGAAVALLGLDQAGDGDRLAAHHRHFGMQLVVVDADVAADLRPGQRSAS